MFGSLSETAIEPIWRSLHYLVFPCAALLFLHSIFTDPNLKDGHPDLLGGGKVLVEISALISLTATTIRVLFRWKRISPQVNAVLGLMRLRCIAIIGK